MTDGLRLGDAYGATIERIKAQGGGKSRLGMEALMWISYAERPLMADQLCHALAVEPGSTDFNADNVPSTSILVSCCQGLITIDKEVSTVRLIHFTLKEYLSSCPDICTRPHSAMAETCLAYLNSKQVKALSADPSSHILDTPFLGYCSVYWGVHVKRDFSHQAGSLALELLQDYDDHISAQSLLRQIGYMSLGRQDMGFRFNGLHCASFFGIVEVVATLLEMERYDINRADYWGYTPLAWAAENGHEGVVKILLRQAEADPNKADNNGDTPLSHAARGGHEEIVKMLLHQAEVNPNKQDNHGDTPLSHAACGGYEGVVKILLQRDEVNPDKPDFHGQTPLLHAAQSGHVEVVKLLLERDKVSPDKKDNYGQTPLQNAARGGHEEVVKILLERNEVNPDKQDNDGDTPLSHASCSGHAGVVKILLQRNEAKPDKPDNHGRTPLLGAARGGHEEVIKILLGGDEVNPNKQDDYGDTPLVHTAHGGYEVVMGTIRS